MLSGNLLFGIKLNGLQLLWRPPPPLQQHNNINKNNGSIVEQGDGLRTMTALAKRVIMVLKIFNIFCSLNDIRTDEYVKLEIKLISMNRIDVWELFMSSNICFACWRSDRRSSMRKVFPFRIG